MISLMSSNLERWHARSLFLNKQLDNDLEVWNDLGRKRSIQTFSLRIISKQRFPSNFVPSPLFEQISISNFLNYTFLPFLGSLQNSSKFLTCSNQKKNLLILKNQTKTFFKTQDTYLLIFGFKKVGSQEILLRNCWHGFISRHFFKARAKYAACKGSS